MTACHEPLDKFEQLRMHAEDLIRKRLDFALTSPTDIIELINELRIHQAELEIQNDELKQAQFELSKLNNEFEDLYEFAPCGYLTINSKRIIKRANLFAAMLLRGLRERITNTCFSQYLARGWQSFYFDACEKAGETGKKQSLELQLDTDTDSPVWVRADIHADRAATGEVIQWRMVLLDITERMIAEKKLKEYQYYLENLVAERTAKADNRARQLQQLAVELSDAENRERKRISTILHDDFQQLLVYIKINLNSLLPDAIADHQIMEKLDFIRLLLNECIEKSRNLSYDLNPPFLSQDGLISALEWLAGDMMENYSFQVLMQASPEAEPASLTIASVLFRSIRELLMNTFKHSGVKSASVKAHARNGQIRVSVEDSGKGFDYDAVKADQRSNMGFGLFNIKDRITFLGGFMDVKSAPGRGCHVKLIVPMKNADLKAGNSTGERRLFKGNPF